MKIKDLKEKFKNGGVSKSEFITQMHEFHKTLFDFSNSISNTEIAEISIINGKVIYTSNATNYHNGGSKFISDINDSRTAPVEAFNFDFYEPKDSEIIYRLVKDGDTIFDIGANIGWYSIHLARKLNKSKIYAFEPIPATFNQLEQNINLNKCENIIPNNIALTDRKQRLSFYYSPKNTVASSSRNIMENADAALVECDANTIDEFISEHKITSLDFIKCDVEGAEYFVYKGGMKVFEKYKPIIFTEMLRKWASKFDYHPNDIINLFSTIGYKCFLINNNILSEIKEITEITTETNFVFLHSEKHKPEMQQFIK
ncbi:MAG: FkbM family methyltransferase [Burkholderiales bacterium]|nr:FkbM family methyltransferase [Bacteroidia bacterium]